ncbi:hypothetical protein C8R46DRAFT_1059119 [Mycena filopes]|nr:hypothetical protein C8R46DRAFT_1059119 [Mycena filopes]
MKFSPYKRRPSKSSVASSAKERVRQTDPNRANCLATNNPFPRACLQFAHILAQATSNIQLTLLEWWWQMAFWTLYIDTHFNIFVLRSDLHLSMDSDDWTLLPHHRVITQIYEWTTAVTEADPTGYNKNQRVPISKLYEGETDFTYFFLPLKDEMKKVAIHRFPTSEPAVDTTVDGDFDPLDFVTHSYPFTTIGPLTSHVHPHFVIFAAGQKLFKMAEAVSEREFKDILARLAKITSFGHDGDADSQDVISKNLTSLHDIVAIHARWTATTIEHEDFHVLRDEDFHVPQDEDFPEHEWLHHPAADLCVKHQCDHELQKQRKK